MSTVQKPPPDWELVLKRNPVERLKRRRRRSASATSCPR